MMDRGHFHLAHTGMLLPYHLNNPLHNRCILPEECKDFIPGIIVSEYYLLITAIHPRWFHEVFVNEARKAKILNICQKEIIAIAMTPTKYFEINWLI